MRKLSSTFIRDLTTGFLQELLHFIQVDQTLCLGIRENYINIYYRGGNLFRLSEGKNSYTGTFDSKYFKSSPSWFVTTLPSSTIQNAADVLQWLQIFPLLKQTIDFYFGCVTSKEEREFQQLIVRDNNFGNQATSTDFFICDIEYSCSVGRFDMIGVQWSSTSASRKKREGHRLVFIEVKSGDKALTGEAGLRSHISDINTFLDTPKNVENLKEEMVSLFVQQHQLGLIKNTHALEGFGTQTPLYLVVLINHDPASSVLKRECDLLPTLKGAELAFIESNFLGFGLFEDRLLNLTKFIGTL